MTADIPGLEPDFAEKWHAGTYVVSGTFFRDGTNAEPEHVVSSTSDLYSQTRANQKMRWPRGVAGYFIIPVLCAPHFSREIEEWARCHHRYKWAIWLEPILYDTSQNTILMRGDYGSYGSAFYPHLGTLFTRAVKRAGEHFDHKEPPKIK